MATERDLASPPRVQTMDELARLLDESCAREFTARKAAADAVAALQEERVARSRLEQTIALGEARATASARRVRVSGSIFASGIVVFATAAPLAFFSIFGLVSNGSFYALGACPTSYCWLLLALMPTDAMLIRFIAAFTILALCGFAAMFSVAAALIGTEMRCVYASSDTCRVVATGVSLFAVSCVAMIGPFAYTLRQRPDAPRVSLGGARQVACQKLGRGLGTMAFALGLPVAWALAQEEDSFVVTPRVALRASWRYFRVIFIIWSLMWLLTVVAATSLGASFESEPVLASLVVCAACFMLVAVLCSPGNRSRIHERLGRLGTLGSLTAASGIAARLNNRDPKVAMVFAEKRFRGLSFDRLSREDFDSNQDTGLHSRTLAKTLGHVDCFVSHSWHDPADEKWAALQKWAAAFASREDRHPLLWLDKACIDQNDIAENLASLPIFLAGCRHLLVLIGTTFCERLWCVMEIFTFLKMGAPLANITCLDIMYSGGDLLDDLLAQHARLAERFSTFDVDKAKCFVEEERQRLLAVIESSFGTAAAFNSLVHGLIQSSAPPMRRSLRGSSTTVLPY